jgi:hypothetical protein
MLPRTTIVEIAKMAKGKALSEWPIASGDAWIEYVRAKATNAVPVRTQREGDGGVRDGR